MLWDVLSSHRLTSVKFDGPVFTATIHPRDDTQFIACPVMAAPVLVRGAGRGDSELSRHTLAISEDDCGGGSGAAGGSSSKTRVDQGVFAIFSRKGERIYAGAWRCSRECLRMNTDLAIMSCARI